MEDDIQKDTENAIDKHKKKSKESVRKSFRLLSGSLSKSAPLDFGPKIIFPHYFVSERGLAHVYKKAIYYFPVSYFCFAASQN